MRHNSSTMWWTSILLILISTIAYGKLTLAAESSADGGARPYVMGVFPHLPPRELEKVFAPMAADLGESIKRKIIFRSSTTYEKFSSQLDKQEFDIAFVQPFDYIRAADKYGYQPLATRTQRLSAILVVTQDSNIKDIKDLKGMHISLPPETAAVSHLIKGHLAKNGIKPGKDVKISHHRSHVSCMQQVLIGESDICGTAAPALRFFQKRMKVKLKTVMKTIDIPHTLFTIHPKVSDSDKEIIKQRIINWANTNKGKELLKRGSLKPFIGISDSEYDIVREMSRE